jgi:tetratricopeptide (TPR) repeat protein
VGYEESFMTRSRLACALVLLLPSLAVAGPFEQGIEALDRRDYDAAIACFDTCIRDNPRDVSALGNRGLAWAGKNDLDRAIADYSRAIDLNARIAILFVNRANACADKKEFNRAVADYTRALRLEPKMVAALAGRANAFAGAMDYNHAIADYSLAIQLDPKDVVLFANRGTAFINRRLYGKAIADFREAIRLDPKYAPAWNNFAWVLATCPNEQLRDGSVAVAHATRACELTSWKATGPLTTLAAAYAECGKFPEAIRWEKQAQALGLPSKYEKDRSEMRLKQYESGQPYHDP